jgi:hypothetical protein
MGVESAGYGEEGSEVEAIPSTDSVPSLNGTSRGLSDLKLNHIFLEAPWLSMSNLLYEASESVLDQPVRKCLYLQSETQ